MEQNSKTTDSPPPTSSANSPHETQPALSQKLPLLHFRYAELRLHVRNHKCTFLDRAERAHAILSAGCQSCGVLYVAELFGGALVAEGIEEEVDLAVLRDMGITYGQGYLLGRPQARPSGSLPPEVARLLRARRIAVFPEIREASSSALTVASLILDVPPVTPSTTNQEMLEIFRKLGDVHGVAVVDEGRPVGLVNHQRFLDQYSRPFQIRAACHFDDEARGNGGINAEDRQGNHAFFPLTTMAVGMVAVKPGDYKSHEELADVAASAKRSAKHSANSMALCEKGLCSTMEFSSEFPGNSDSYGLNLPMLAANRVIIG